MKLEVWQICLGLAVVVVISITVGIKYYAKYRRLALLEIRAIKTALLDLAGNENALVYVTRYEYLVSFYGILAEEVGFHYTEPYLLAAASMKNYITRAKKAAKEVDYACWAHEQGLDVRSTADYENIVVRRSHAKEHIRLLDNEQAILDGFVASLMDTHGPGIARSPAKNHSELPAHS